MGLERSRGLGAGGLGRARTAGEFGCLRGVREAAEGRSVVCSVCSGAARTHSCQKCTVAYSWKHWKMIAHSIASKKNE